MTVNQSCAARLTSWVDGGAARLARLFWPSLCILCGQRGQPALDLCSDCDAELPRIGPACSICSLPLASSVTVPICGGCLRRRPSFHASCIPFRYAYPLDHLVRAFKYGGRGHNGRVLGSLLARHLRLARKEPWPQLLVPVPLAPRRYRQRGFNQAIDLALSLRSIDGLTIATDRVIRSRETPEQASLGRKQRSRNVRGAFRLTRDLRERHVAILDDVVTTGSTVNELAEVLTHAGAHRIEVWALARVSEK